MVVRHLVLDVDVCAAVDKRPYQRQVVARRGGIRSCRRDDLVQSRPTQLRRRTDRDVQTDRQTDRPIKKANMRYGSPMFKNVQDNMFLLKTALKVGNFQYFEQCPHIIFFLQISLYLSKKTSHLEQQRIKITSSVCFWQLLGHRRQTVVNTLRRRLLQHDRLRSTENADYMHSVVA